MSTSLKDYLKKLQDEIEEKSNALTNSHSVPIQQKMYDAQVDLIEDILEWMEEKEIELPDWKEALEGNAGHPDATPEVYRVHFKRGAEWAKQWIEKLVK